MNFNKNLSPPEKTKTMPAFNILYFLVCMYRYPLVSLVAYQL